MVAPAPGDVEQSAKGVGEGAGDGAGEAAAGVGLTVALDGEGLPETAAAVRLGLYPASAKIVAAMTINSPAAKARPLGPTFIRRCNETQRGSFRRA